MDRQEFVKIMASELVLHGVPEQCSFSDLLCNYVEEGVVFLLGVVKGKQRFFLSNIVKYVEMENFRTPLEFIQIRAEEYRSRLDAKVNPIALPSSVLN